MQMAYKDPARITERDFCIRCFYRRRDNTGGDTRPVPLTASSQAEWLAGLQEHGVMVAAFSPTDF